MLNRNTILAAAHISSGTQIGDHNVFHMHTVIGHVPQDTAFTGTPSFIVARTDPDNLAKVTGITFIRGAQAFNAFKAAIDSALGSDE